MRKYFIIIRSLLAGAFLLLPVAMRAQVFKASHLQKAYEALRLDEQDRSDLIIRKSADGIIEHIGIPLFSTEMRTLLPSPIYDYLEFALLDHKYQISKNTLQQQRIKFFKGSWDEMERITPSDACTIDNRDDKWYIVRWSCNNQEILSVVVPIDYELLANSSRREMEQDFSRNLKRYQPATKQESATKHRLNASQPKETLSDILLTPDHASVQVSLSIKFLYAGFHKETISVTLPQWMGFCHSEGCTPYYIYEGADKDQASAMLLMYNRSEGYAHLLHLHAPISQLEATMQNYQGKLYMFIPTNNVADLYAQATGKSTPKIIK